MDSNLTGASYAEEESLKVLPTTPIWRELEPNSYSDLGGELSNVARAPINASRQRKKGTIVDLDASGGFNTDVTQNNTVRLMQGFCFADAREKPSTAPINGTAVAITAVDGTGEEYQASSGLDVFLAGHLVKASNFANSANNGLKRVVTAATGALTVAEDLVADASPSATSTIEAVGFQFPSGDLGIVASASSITLTSSVTDFTTLGLNVGEWIFIGGDLTAEKFAGVAPGYARIKAIGANAMDLDESTFAATTDTGTSKTVRIFFGTVVRNEKDASLIKRRSYNIERTLGSDNDGVQSQYLEGAIPNEFTLNIPTTDKLNADLSFVAMDEVQRTGAEGIKLGTRLTLVSEDAFNTSSDIYRMKLSVVDPVTLNPTALFAYVLEANIGIKNNVTPNKAIGVLGAFDATAGDFEVSGSITAYFDDIAAVAAVRKNSDVAFNVIVAKQNAGLVFDMPLIWLGGGRLNVEKDNPIKIPLDVNAAECPAGYTLLATYLSYLPNSAMPA